MTANLFPVPYTLLYTSTPKDNFFQNCMSSLTGEILHCRDNQTILQGNVIMSNQFESNQLEYNHTPVELSAEELDAVAGGIDIYLSGSTFEQQDVFSASRFGSRRRRSGGSSLFRSSFISSSAFQMIGLGFNSVSDALSFVAGFARLFGRR